ncbi:hypothetical protein BH11MYX4_BH11MYX4_38750 [soil metagenome]
MLLRIVSSTSKVLASVLVCAVVLTGCAAEADEAATGASADELNGRSAGRTLVSPSGLCLDVWQASTQDGAKTVIHTCNGGLNQRFSLKTVARSVEGEFEILDGNGKCLDVWEAKTTNGTSVRIRGCHGGANQRWKLRAADVTASGELTFLVVSVQSNKCLDVWLAKTESASDVAISDCHGGSNQQWRFGGR